MEITTIEELNKFYNKEYNNLVDRISNQNKIDKNKAKEVLTEMYMMLSSKQSIQINNIYNFMHKYAYNAIHLFKNTKENRRKQKEVNLIVWEDEELTNNFLDEQLMKNDTEYNYVKEEVYQKLENEVDKLQLDEKVLYDLYYKRNLSYREIGKLLKTPHSSIYKQMMEVKNKLFDNLK